jgi:hypothetical protein
MKKKGSGHLEMILAFTIFIVAVMFILTYIKPLENNTLSEVVAISLKDSLIKKASVSLTTIFVNGTNQCVPPTFLNKAIVEPIESEGYYYVYSSEEFDNVIDPCTENVKIGSISVEEILSNKGLQLLSNKYYDNYSELKKELNVPQAIDFEIYSISPDFYLNMTKDIPEGINILAKKYPLLILNSEGDLINVEMVFRLW